MTHFRPRAQKRLAEVQRLFDLERRRNKEYEQSERVKYLEQLNKQLEAQAPKLSAALQRAFEAEDMVSDLRKKLFEVQQQNQNAEARVSNLQQTMVILAKDHDKFVDELRQQHKEEVDTLKAEHKMEIEQLMHEKIAVERRAEARKTRRKKVQESEKEESAIEEKQEEPTGTDLLHFLMESVGLVHYFEIFHDFGIETIDDLQSDDVTHDLLLSEDIGMSEEEAQILRRKLEELHRDDSEE